VIVASDCSICLTTLPAVMRHDPEATILWLDAHGDFNTPETTLSGFLGGMCLAGACGLWDAGFGAPRVDPASVVMCGVRDLDGGELALLETQGVVRITRPAQLADALAGRRVFVHLDLDVLDPSEGRANEYAAAGGLSLAGLERSIHLVGSHFEVAGAAMTAYDPSCDPAGQVARAALRVARAIRAAAR
jgi:arginase family enzyme